MITTIILLTFLGIGIYLKRTSMEFELTSFFFIIFSSIILLIHLLFWSLSSYNFNLFNTERDAFKQTLEISRESGNLLETATIVTEISDWNQKLASVKYHNSIYILDCYIDDRIEELEPIK